MFPSDKGSPSFFNSNKMEIENGQRSLANFINKLNTEKQMYKQKFEIYSQQNKILTQVLHSNLELKKENHLLKEANELINSKVMNDTKLKVENHFLKSDMIKVKKEIIKYIKNVENEREQHREEVNKLRNKITHLTNTNERNELLVKKCRKYP